MRPLVMILAAIASFLIASFASSQWMTLLTWWNQVPFGKADPILGYDAAMYVFTLPALELLRGMLHRASCCSPPPAWPRCISRRARSR